MPVSKWPLLILLFITLSYMKKYFSEKNALTVVTSAFCFVMLIKAVAIDRNLWESVAFALAFSFSIEIICHRAKESKG